MANNGKEVLHSRVDNGKVHMTAACCFSCTARVLSFRGTLSCYCDLRSSVLAIVQCHFLTQAEIQMPQASTIQASVPLKGGSSIGREAGLHAWASTALLSCDVQLVPQALAAWLA